MPNRVRVFREAAGLSLPDLYRRVPTLTKVRISELDASSRLIPKIPTAAMLAKGLGVQVMDLVSLDTTTLEFLEMITPPTPDEKRAIQAALRELKASE